MASRSIHFRTFIFNCIWCFNIRIIRKRAKIKIMGKLIYNKVSNSPSYPKNVTVGINYIFDRFKKIKYTTLHKLYFLRTEYKLTGKITIDGLFHDMDKLILLIFTSKSLKDIHQIHRLKSKHHQNDIKKTKKDYIQMVIDWECARFTKSDKPLNARETLIKFYPELQDDILPIINSLNL